jgi:hypothetical protein
MITHEYRLLIRLKGQSDYVESAGITIGQCPSGKILRTTHGDRRISVRVERQIDGDVSTGTQWQIFAEEI